MQICLPAILIRYITTRLLMTVSACYGAQALPKGFIAHCAMFCLSQASDQNVYSLH